MKVTGTKVVLNLTGADNMKHVEPDDFVIHLRSFQGGIEHSRYAGKVSNAYTVFAPVPEVEPRFFRWVLKSQGFIQELNATTEQLRDGQSIKFEQFSRIGLPCPPLVEQRRIADFLDNQVARIDEVLEARESQRGKIQEATLVKFLELTAGDELSANWKVAQAFRSGSGTTPASDRAEYFDGDIPWVASGDLNDSELFVTSRNVTHQALADYSALKIHGSGSLLVAMYGATVGKTALLRVDACVNQAVCVLRPTGPVLAAFAQFWFMAHRPEVVTLASGGGQPNISQDTVRSLRFRVGDQAWQESRLAQLRQVEESSENVIAVSNRSSRLLEEYKRSLITAAVTGEFDVSSASGRGVAA